MRTLALAAVALVGALVAQPALAACGRDTVVVVGTADEERATCRALENVLGYFASIGLNPDPAFTITFRDEVYIDILAHDSGRVTGRERVSGFFDMGRRVVEVTRADSPAQRARRPWGIAWGSAIAFSILQHELTHMVAGSLLGAAYKDLSKPWHEYIAYAVQLDLMPEALRTAALASSPGLEPFDHVEHVNPMVYGADPDTFGLRAYVDSQSRGGRAFIRALLLKEVPFDLREMEFF